MKPILYTLLFLLYAGVTQAQDEASGIAEPANSGNIYMDVLIIAIILTALLILLAAVILLRSVKIVSKELAKPELAPQPAPAPLLEYKEWAEIQKSKPGIWSKVLGLRPLYEEKDMMLEHEFDGIAELDNPTPAWFMWLFYGTIAFAFIYLVYFHVLDYGQMQEEEYAIEMQVAGAEQKSIPCPIWK